MNGMRTARWLPRLVSAAVLIAAWELLARWINGLLFPSFTQTMTAAVRVVPETRTSHLLLDLRDRGYARGNVKDSPGEP